LSLFGPGIQKKWAPRGQGHVVINKNLDCSPCTKFGYTPRCKKNAECMKRITVDEVVEKALELLEG
jgi:ADP-heptose:LPS heptosyltransferase